MGNGPHVYSVLAIAGLGLKSKEKLRRRRTATRASNFIASSFFVYILSSPGLSV